MSAIIGAGAGPLMLTGTETIRWLWVERPQEQPYYDWALDHGLPVNHIPVPSMIVCDDTNRRIYFESHESDMQGRPAPRWVHDRLVLSWQHVQLESKAMPIPERQPRPPQSHAPARGVQPQPPRAAPTGVPDATSPTTTPPRPRRRSPKR